MIFQYKKKLSECFVSIIEKDDSLLNCKKKPIVIGLHLLFGEGFNTGSFGNYYSPDLSMSFGGGLSYKKILASFDVTSYRHQLQKIYVGKKTFEESAGTDIINLNLWYRIIDFFKFKLTPFAGIARIEFSTNNSLNEFFKENNHNFVFGCRSDFIFKQKAKCKPDVWIPVNRYKQTTIQARVLVTRVNFYNDFEGCLVNFSLGLSWSVNRLIMK